ncbi:MAG: ATP-dependent Lon protease, partial [Thermoguttaceae bacterium]|nr:ATP-dependent Lon protease [Thermoguttaceae bacterium]
PGWEIPKYLPEHFTDQLGFITDYFAEVLRELRKTSCADVYSRYFKLGRDLSQRDVIAVKKMVSGLTKILYPDGRFGKEQIEEILRFALEQRRRVKEQLKKIGGMEFFEVNFSYIDNETFAEEYVTVPEQGSGKLIPEGIGKPGHIYTVSRGKSGLLGVYKIETQVTNGTGKLEKTGIGSDREARESIDTAFKFLRANGKGISSSVNTTTKDYLIHVQDMAGNGAPKNLSLSAMIALCSAVLGKPPLPGLAVIGDFTIGGTLTGVEELANVLQVCLDAGAKRVLLPMSSASDLATVPPELMVKFDLIFYDAPEAAVFKALGAN